jgi:uncharacterized protein
MWIPRYTEDLVRSFARQFPVVLITGPRQSGKTSLLQQVYPDYSYITLDDPGRLEIAHKLPDQFFNNIKTPAIIDEAQYAPEIFRYLKIAVDAKRRNGSFFITGSQQFNLMQNVTESLAGRCGIINLMTLSMNELNSATSFTLHDYIARGGYPALYSQKNISYSQWYPSYINTYLERDIRNITSVHNLRDFNRFIRALAMRSAQILSLSDLARDIGIAPNTVKSWISVLEASGIIKILEPYFNNKGKRLVKSPKLYFTDTGLLTHLLGLSSWQNIIASPLAGAIWETYAFCQLHHAFLKLGNISPGLWFWRDQSGNEVDFIVERGGSFIVYEAKLKENPGKDDCKGFEKLKAFYGEKSVIKGYVICPVKKNYPIDKGIEANNGVDLMIN